MTLLMLLCTQEWAAMNVRPVMAWMDKEQQARGARVIWIEQCVAKKEIWQ